MNRNFLLFITALLAAFSASAQCRISGKTKVCLGDMATYEIPSGAKSAKWKFGDGFSSNDLKAKHLYKNKGNFTITCTAVLSSGAQCTDSLQVEVLGLPSSSFVRIGSLDSCQFVNHVCFEDRSRPAVIGQDIVKRMVIWGDGAYDQSLTPGFEPEVCHTFNSADLFKVKFEITDIYGCKNTQQHKVRIVKGPQAFVTHTITEPVCGTFKVCFNNESLTPANTNNTYDWVLNGQAFTHNTKTIECRSSDTSITYYVRLLATTAGGCRSEFKDTVAITIKPLDVAIGGNTNICYGAPLAPQFWITGDKNYRIRWTGSAVNKNQTSDTLSFSPKAVKLTPGIHTIYATITRGSCTKTLSMNYTVAGPIAEFRMSGRVQCEMKKKLYMWDETQLTDKSKASWRWLVEDDYGDDCVSWRSQGQNLNKNCLQSKDWYHKHSFDTSYSSKLFPVHMWVHDSITGCTDSTKRMVRKYCRVKFGNCGMLTLCQGDPFLLRTEYSDPEVDPISYSLDTGRTFYPFYSNLPPQYVGIYGVMLTWKKAKPDSAEDFGNDSLVIYKDTTKGYDTLFYPNLLEIISVHPNDNFDVSYQGLNPKKVTIKPQDPMFNAGDHVRIDWGDSTSTDTFLEEAGRLDSFTHNYKYSRYRGQVNIVMHNSRGCEQKKNIQIGWGLVLSLQQDDEKCGNKNVCFTPIVLDYGLNKKWEVTDSIPRYFKWDFGDSTQSTDSFRTCHYYSKPGRYKVKLWVRDSLGHQDSAIQLVIIQEIVAGIMPESKEFYCSEIKQLLDSSALLVQDPNDAIEEYYWDFGEGTFTTIEKDPYHSFESGGDYHISHVVKSRKGCTDTTDFKIHISGSQASFELVGDTVGCAPFLATFKNTSKFCRQYIWEYGDYDNTTHNTTILGNDTFRYPKGGRFSVSLVGIDTFYNSITGNAYYCNSYYPSNDSPIIVTVLPSPKTGLVGPDTLCEGSTAKFLSLSEKDYETDAWYFSPNNTRLLLKPGQEIMRRFDVAGVYTINLRPYYPLLDGQPVCFDSAEKKITVLGVRAAFDIDPSSVDPVYHFINQSQPEDASYKWNFGQPSSADNYSEEVHPTHDFYPERNPFKVCLTATIPKGCVDTACRWITVAYFEDIKMANVFTPNEDDALNRSWDIIIDGERLYDLKIYNRWGELVFESKEDAEAGATGNWNGQVMNTGALCPEGTYFYEFTFAFSRNNPAPRTVNGSITLIR